MSSYDRATPHSGVGRVRYSSLYFPAASLVFPLPEPWLQILSALFTRCFLFHDEKGKCTALSISGNQTSDFCSCTLMQKLSCKPPSLSVLGLLNSLNCTDNSHLLALRPPLLIPAVKGRIGQVSLKDVNT